MYIEQRDKEIQEKKDLMSFINNMKNNTNSSIGRDGEERVHNALLKNSKYSTMEIDDVSSTLGGGDLNRNVGVAVRPWPLFVGPQMKVDKFTLSFEVGTDTELSFDSGLIITFGYRWEF